MRRWLIGLLFLLSGATALCYQVAWTRHLVLLFGNTSHAIALILAAYMLGLALGSEAGGRWADRSRRPAVAYALIEAAIGLYAVAFPWVEGAVRGAYLGLGVSAPPLLFLGAFLLLLVPTFLMGATLPLLVRATVTRAEATGATVGWLYGINIVGAVLGAAGTGFWLLETAGILGATYWSAAVNGLIGVAGLVLLRDAVRTEAPPAPEPDAPAAPSTVSAPAGAARAALVAVLAAGFVGLAAEVVWTRLLIFFLQGFTYTFSAMLAMFLAGLAIGGFLFGRIAARTSRPAAVLARLQVGIGVAAAGVLLLLTNYLDVALWSFETAGALTGQTDIRVHHRMSLLLSSAITLLPPAILMGGVFPLAAAAYQRGLGDLGTRIGRLYAVNTIGAVLGSLGAGFVLVPLIGAPWTAAVVAGASIVAGAAVAWLGREPDRRPVALPLVGGAVATALVLAAAPWEPFILHSHPFAGTRARENRLEETLQGTVCQVSVVRNERDDYTLLYTDEFQAAGTKPEYRYMRMLAHLPVALVERPERVLVICFGTGTTCGSVSTHADVKQLDIVEISPEVLAVADRFADVNRDVLNGAGRDDLDVRVHIDDGRNFVLRSEEQWDVLTLEPLMPYTPAAIHFYTSDFYRECAPRLAEGGVMCQWIPLQGMSGDHFLRLVRSFTDVFPDAAVFFVDGAVALVGGPGPLVLDYERVARALGRPAVREDLAAVGYEDPVRALGTYVSGGAPLVTYLDERGVEPITDEFPVLEFHPIPSNTVLKHLYENLRHMVEMRAALPGLPVELPGGADRAVLDDRFRMALRTGNYLLTGMLRSEEAGLLVRLKRDAAAGEALEAAREAFLLAHSLDPGDAAAARNHEGIERVWHVIQANAALAKDDLERAERHLEQAIEYPALRQEDHAFTLLARVRNRRGDHAGALAAALEATRRFPRGREALGERAFARNRLHDRSGAARDYRRALEGEPLSTLPAHLARDAELVLGGGGDDASPRDGAAAIAAALDGGAPGDVPQRLHLALLEQEFPDAYDAAFASDLSTAGDTGAAELDRALAFERLRLGGPAGAVDAAVRAVVDVRTPEAVRAAAARLLADHDRAALARVLVPSAPSLPLLLPVAAHAPDRRVADALAALLDHPEKDVRAAAQGSLFALVGDAAPGLDRLDPATLGTRFHRAAVGLIRSWWLRERGTFRFRSRGQ